MRRKRSEYYSYSAAYCLKLFHSLQGSVPEETDLWEFDTIRRRTFQAAFKAVIPPNFPNDSSLIAPTVKPAARLPTSLRSLFDDDTLHFGVETLRAPVPPPPPLRDTPSPTLPSSSSPSRDRTLFKRTIAPTDSTDDVQMAKYNDFAFPPRTVSRAKSKLTMPTSTKEENALLEERIESIVLYLIFSCRCLISGHKLLFPSWRLLRPLLFCHQ
jgi:hypothetical protein